MELLRPCEDAQFGAKTASYTGTAGTTATWPAGPQGVLVWCSTDAYVRVGIGATATTADTPLPAGTPVTVHATQGKMEPWRVSAIQVSTGGTLYAKPINIR